MSSRGSPTSAVDTSASCALVFFGNDGRFGFALLRGDLGDAVGVDFEGSSSSEEGITDYGDDLCSVINACGKGKI